MPFQSGHGNVSCGTAASKLGRRAAFAQQDRPAAAAQHGSAHMLCQVSYRFGLLSPELVTVVPP
jgi:hypothetical protein